LRSLLKTMSEELLQFLFSGYYRHNLVQVLADLENINIAVRAAKEFIKDNP